MLYFIGVWVKTAQTISDKYIPLIIGAVGIIICAVYVMATCEFLTQQDIWMAIFVSVTQGILVAALSTYCNQIVKQLGKDE